MTNGYGEMDMYGTYGEGELSPYELLMRMKSWNKAIYLTIENNDEQMKTQLALLDGEIRQNVLDVKNGLETLVSTTAQGIQTTISDTKQQLETQITTTAAGLQASITDTKNGLQTQITANANGIASKVSSTDFNGNKIASLITQSSTAINAMAQALNLSGYVTFSSLTASGTTNIDGARITTGLISADRISASTVLAKLISAGGIDASYITSGTISANRLSADAITSTLINAGGINASLITAGSISADRISGGVLSGVTINSYTDANIGDRIFLGSPYNPYRAKGIYFGLSESSSTARITSNSGVLSISGEELHLSHLGTWSGFAGADTSNLSIGYSSTSKRLYVKINGLDVGYVTLT